MPTSVWSSEIEDAIAEARSPQVRRIQVSGQSVEVPYPFPSPSDWRDVWIYQLLVDRFHNPSVPPRYSFDGEHSAFQGGTFEGIRQQLDYLKDLGVGALWLSPVQKNCQYQDGTYHGYGIQDFLAIEPRFASRPDDAKKDPRLVETELQDLIDEAHALGMYVIFDIVLNHAGDVFEYEGLGATVPFRSEPYTIRWRDEDGTPRQDWTEAPADPPADGAVWPSELRRNVLFRRQGKGGEAGGDFESLKELLTAFQEFSPERGPHHPVHNTLIRAYQNLIAKYDVDGFRIDTLKFIEPEFARIFGNAIREFTLSIGKKNFFAFGEVFDEEEQIARFIGRQAMDSGELVGVDAALDFPLFFRLPGVAKGLAPPSVVARMYEHRKGVQRGIVSSHGDASRYFVTFLDNHDLHQRFYYQDPQDIYRYDDQVSLALGCLFSLQGIPCVYYGTEQGLSGAGATLEAVREAMWGMPGAFDRSHPFFKTVQALSALRHNHPALRYGRQYFRPISGDGVHFGVSPFPAGVVAFSRILQDKEVVVVANTNSTQGWSGEVIVDFALNSRDSTFEILFSNKTSDQASAPGAVAERAAGSVAIEEVNGVVGRGPIRVITAHLQPMEAQVLGR